MSGQLTAESILQLSEEMEQHTPEDILRWAIAEFAPSIAMSSSFQTQSLPLLHMAAYAMLYDLPDHPLLEKGYRSIGCSSCTRPVQEGDDERAGRWAGRGKTECGLHTELFQKRDLDNNQAPREFLFKMLP